MQKNPTTLPTHAHPDELAIHDAITDFPELSPAQYAALKNDIAERGVQQKIVVASRNANGENGALYIIDGRHRRRVASEIGLAEVPIEIRDDVTPHDYALASALTGRQLTTSGRVLMIFEHHPALAEDAQARKTSGLKRGKESPRADKIRTEKNRNPDYTLKHEQVIGEEQRESFRALAERYQVPEKYFRILALTKTSCRCEEEWQMVRTWVFEGEKSWADMRTSLAGWQAEHSIGDDDKLAPRKLPTNPETGIIRSLTYLKLNFAQWDRLTPEKRNEASLLWEEVKKSLPKALK